MKLLFSVALAITILIGRMVVVVVFLPNRMKLLGDVVTPIVSISFCNSNLSSILAFSFIP